MHVNPPTSFPGSLSSLGRWREAEKRDPGNEVGKSAWCPRD